MSYTYLVELDVDDNRAYSSGLAALENVTYLEWSAGMNQPYLSISNPALLRMTLNNKDGRYSQDDSSAAYYGLLHPGRLIRVRTIHNGTTETMTELRITDVSDTFGEFVLYPQVQIVCMDKIKELLSMEYYPPLQQDVRGDEVLTKIHETAEVVWPNNRSYFFIGEDSIDGVKQLYGGTDTDFDEALTVLDWVGDHLGQDKQGNAQRLIRDVLKAEVFGMYYFQPRTGMYCFRNRRHSKTTPLVTTFRTDGSYLTAAQTSNGRNPYGMGPLNKIELSYKPRSVGGVGAVLYANTNEIRIPVNIEKPKKIRGKFFDPDNENARVGGVDVIPPQRGIDYVANNQADGSGGDRTNDIIVSYTITGSSIEYVITNPTHPPVYMTTLQVRGTPLIAYKDEVVESQNDESFYSYDGFDASDSLIISDGETVQAIADMLVNLFGEPLKTIDRLSLVVSEEIAAYAQVLTIGNKINVRNSNETHDADYIIMGEQHQIQIERGLHNVHYTLRAVDILSLFTIDTDVIDGRAVIDI